MIKNNITLTKHKEKRDHVTLLNLQILRIIGILGGDGRVETEVFNGITL